MCTVIFQVIVFILFGIAVTSLGTNADCPLELNPPRVVVRYGESVSVTCSTSFKDHEGMGWEASVGDTGNVEGVMHLNWTAKNLEDWSIEPKCFLNREDEGQCQQNLFLVLYKPPDGVSTSVLSHTGPMVEGTEYQLSCDVLNVAPVQNLIVIWYKGNETIMRNSSDDQIKTPVNTTSILTIVPSRHDDGAQYRCEAQLDLGPEGPRYRIASLYPYLQVNYGPHIKCTTSPFIERESLEDHCSVEGNPSPTILWLKNGQSIDPSTPLKRGDSGLYTIEAKGRTTVNKEVYVDVQYGPEILCPKTYTVAEHSTPNLTCTAEGSPKPDIRWFKNEDHVVLPEILRRSDAGQYVIVASNSISTVKHTMDIDVQYPPSEILELEDTEGNNGSTVGLKCSSTGNPQPSYRWSYYKASNVEVENEDGVSLLTIHNAGGSNIGSYSCFAQNKLGEVSKTARVTVKGANADCPLELNPPRVVVRYGESVSVTCSTSFKDHEGMGWEASVGDTGNVEGAMHLNWTAKNLEDWSIEPKCFLNREYQDQCQANLSLVLYKPPDSVSISLLNHTGPMVEGTEYELSCDVLNVAPVQNLIVIWYKGNETMMTNFSDDRIKTPVNRSSILTIIPSRHLEYRCEAQLDLGPKGPQPPPTVSSVPLNVTVHYKPHINATKLPARIPVLRGYPEDLVCEAEGYPQPKIVWEYGAEKHVLVAGGNLTVWEAGLYNCTASNVVETSFIVVEVVLKEDYLPLIAGFVAIAVGVISAIFVFIFFIYYKNTRMGHYSLKDAKLQNGRDMPLPMTKVS